VLVAHSVSVAGVVVNAGGQILVIRRRDNGQWQIPGGVLEGGERLEDGVRREVLEETGIEVHVDHLTGVYHHLVRDVVALVYRCTPVGGRATTSQESSQVCWWDAETVMARFAPMFSVRVTDALSGKVQSRNHDGHRLR
jgi:8-oxo-dGTP diphosphatase